MRKEGIMEEKLKRVKDMEEAFDRARSAMQALSQAFESYHGVSEDFDRLSEYLSCGEWMADFLTDEAGGFPFDLKRGVLSEDGLYDLLTENEALMTSMKAFFEGK